MYYSQITHYSIKKHYYFTPNLHSQAINYLRKDYFKTSCFLLIAYFKRKTKIHFNYFRFNLKTTTLLYSSFSLIFTTHYSHFFPLILFFHSIFQFYHFRISPLKQLHYYPINQLYHLIYPLSTAINLHFLLLPSCTLHYYPNCFTYQLIKYHFCLLFLFKLLIFQLWAPLLFLCLKSLFALYCLVLCLFKATRNLFHL